MSRTRDLARRVLRLRLGVNATGVALAQRVRPLTMRFGFSWQCDE